MADRKLFSNEDLLGAIRRFNEEQGAPPAVVDFASGRTPGLPAASTIIGRFGSWSNAIEAAGFPRPKRGRRRAVRF